MTYKTIYSLLISLMLANKVVSHPEIIQQLSSWLLPNFDGTNRLAQAYAAPSQQFFQPLQQQQLQPIQQAQPQFQAQLQQPQFQAQLQQPQPQRVVPQQSSFNYQGSQASLPSSNSPQGPVAFGVARAEPLPPVAFDTDRLAPLQPSTLPPLISLPTQYPPGYFHQEALQSNSVTLSPSASVNYAPPPHPANVQPPAAPAPSAPSVPTTATREPPVENFWFKEGTPILPCGYGVNPLPQYNTPRKRCVPFSPLCGLAFTCIMDV